MNEQKKLVLFLEEKGIKAKTVLLSHPFQKQETHTHMSNDGDSATEQCENIYPPNSLDPVKCMSQCRVLAEKCIVWKQRKQEGGAAMKNLHMLEEYSDDHSTLLNTFYRIDATLKHLDCAVIRNPTQHGERRKMLLMSHQLLAKCIEEYKNLDRA